MKILLYRKDEKVFAKSGVGRAMKHQEEALKLVGVDYTFDEKDDFDIVHLNTVSLNSYLMAKKARRKGKKVVYHGHSTEEDFRNSFLFSNLLAPLFKIWLKICYKTGDVILTPTPYSKHLLETYNLGRPIVDVSNGIGLQLFARDEAKIGDFRKFFKLDSNDKVIVSVGHYFERKGLPDFIEVARQFPEYKFIWFGHTPPAAVTKNIREAISRKPENVILPGYIDGRIIQGAYQAADIFFFPSNEETEGIVVLEALAARCQVVVRDIGVYDSWLEDGKNCYKGKSNQEFEVIIKKITQNELPPTIEEGRKTAEERSLVRVGKKLAQIYRDLIKTEA